MMRNARCCFPNPKGFCCMLAMAFGTEVAGRGELEAIMGKTARFYLPGRKRSTPLRSHPRQKTNIHPANLQLS